MTSEAKIAANQANGRKSRGPVTARGRAIASMNALKHGRRSKRLAAMQDVSISCEERRVRWMALHDAKGDIQEFLIARNASVASKLERIDRADAEAFRSSIENADEKEHQEVLALGKCLFESRCGSVGTYGLEPGHSERPKKAVSEKELKELEPSEIIGKLEASELGTVYLLEVWGELRFQLEPGRFWQSPDRLRAIRLLGHQPIDARFDDEVAAIFYASAGLEPRKRKPFQDLSSELYDFQLVELRQEAARRWPELAALKDQEECRQILIEIVDRNVERLEEIRANFEANADSQAERAFAREGFDTSARGKNLYDYELKYTRALNQGITVYNKLTGGRRGVWDEEKAGGKHRRPPSFGMAGGRGSHGADASGARGRVEDEAIDLSWALATDAVGATAEAASVCSAPVPAGNEADAGDAGVAVMKEAERRWGEVTVTTADALACGGLLPERCTGVSDTAEEADTGVARGTDDGDAGVVDCSAAPAEVGGSALPRELGGVAAEAGQDRENVANEPNRGHDAITIQNEDTVEVTANSDAPEALDTRRTNPTAQEENEIRDSTVGVNFRAVPLVDCSG